jgi:hypothetical protein
LDYIKYFKNNFLAFLDLCGNEEKKNYQNELILDCANGVGSKLLDEIRILSGFSDKLKI